jgi:hypothetical protein
MSLSKQQIQPPWERTVALLFTIGIICLASYLVVRTEPIADPVSVDFIRVMLVFGAGVIGATVPGFFNIGWRVAGFIIRAVCACGLVMLSLHLVPTLLPEVSAVAREYEDTSPVIDTSEVPLAVISLTVEEVPGSDGRSFTGVASIELNAGDTPRSDMKLYLAGVTNHGSTLLDLSSAIPAGSGTGTTQVPFVADRIDGAVEACLILPHPSLHVPYRVTQIYNTLVNHGPDGVAHIDFTRAAPPMVAPDGGKACGSES